MINEQDTVNRTLSSFTNMSHGDVLISGNDPFLRDAMASYFQAMEETGAYHTNLAAGREEMVRRFGEW